MSLERERYRLVAQARRKRAAGAVEDAAAVEAEREHRGAQSHVSVARSHQPLRDFVKLLQREARRAVRATAAGRGGAAQRGGDEVQTHLDEEALEPRRHL